MGGGYTHTHSTHSAHTSSASSLIGLRLGFGLFFDWASIGFRPLLRLGDWNFGQGPWKPWAQESCFIRKGSSEPPLGSALTHTWDTWEMPPMRCSKVPVQNQHHTHRFRQIPIDSAGGGVRTRQNAVSEAPPMILSTQMILSRNYAVKAYE